MKHSLQRQSTTQQCKFIKNRPKNQIDQKYNKGSVRLKNCRDTDYKGLPYTI